MKRIGCTLNYNFKNNINQLLAYRITLILFSLFCFGISATPHTPSDQFLNIQQTPLAIAHPLQFSGGGLVMGADRRVWHRNTEQAAAFDGRQWLNYPKFSLPTHLYALQSQNADTLWLGSRQNGLYRYHQPSATSQHLDVDGFGSGELPRYTSSSLCFTADKKTLFSAGAGAVLAIDTVTGRQQRVLPEALTHFPSVIVCKGKYGLLILSDSSMYLIDLETQDAKLLGKLMDHPVISKAIIDKHVASDGLRPILLDKNKLLLAAADQLYLVDLEENKLLPFAAPFPKPISGLVLEQNGRIWIGTSGAGLFALSPQGDILHHLSVENGRLPGNNLTSLTLSDPDWLFGLEEEHLIQISLQPGPFQYLQSGNQTSPWYAASLAVPGEVWLVEAFARILQLDTSSRQFTDMTPFIQQLLAAQGEDGPLQISALHHHTPEEIWFSHRTKLVRFLPQQKTLTLFDKKAGADMGPTRRVRHIFTDRQQRLWFTDLGSVLQFDKATQRFIRWPLADGQLPDANRRFVKIAQDQQDRIWAMGEFGLYQAIDGQLTLVYAFRDQGFLYDMTLDSTGTPWLLSSENLIKINIHANFQVEQFAPPDDFRIQMQSLIADQDHIWIGTRNGLVRFDTQQHRWRQFSWGDGILPVSAYQRGAYSHQGKLIMMTVGGMLVINPGLIPKPQSTQIVRKLQSRSGNDDWQTLDIQQPVVMPEAKHWLEFLLHLTEFRYPEQLRFRYQLAGYDPDWNRSSVSPQFAYAGIPAGKYQLLVEVYYRHNQQIAQSLAIPVHILPPWYRTAWAYGSYAVFSLIALWLFYRYRRQRVQQLIAYESEIASSMQRAVQAQHRQEELTLLGELGKELTAHLDIDGVWDDFKQAAGQLVTFDRLVLLCIQSPDFYSQDPDILFIDELPDSLSFVMQQRIGIHQTEPATTTAMLPEALQQVLQSSSVVHLTISRKQQIYGAVFFAADLANCYDRSSISPLRMLGEFLAVALENIRAHQHSQHLERQLLQQQKVQSLGRLVAGLAHEMNTPAGTAITAASLVQDQLKVTRDTFNAGVLTKQILQRTFDDMEHGNALVQRNLDRLSGLIEQFKLLARVNEQPEVARVALWSLIKTLVEIRKSQNPEIQLSLHLPMQELYLELNQSGLQLILQQLIDNVFVHAAQQRPDLTLTVTLQRTEQQLLLSFCDNGYGLHEEKLDQYLEPFYTTARHRGKVGLGLAIVHNIVTELFAGALNLENNPTGGCCVLMYLPIEIESKTSEGPAL